MIALRAGRRITARRLFAMAPHPVLKMVRDWWLRRAEQHYMICAAVEHQRAKEAMQNESYYQKQAAIARSARN
jgi:hypothetical protein